MPVSISVPTLVIELVIFLLTVVMMERLVFTPIREKWAERDRRIHEGLAASNLGRDEAVRAREDVQRILLEARQQAQRELDTATATTSKQRDELVQQATEEFGRLLDQARTEIAAERERSADALQDRIVDIALLAAHRITGQSFERPETRELAATVVGREGLR